jgi:hypothetical protein
MSEYDSLTHRFIIVFVVIVLALLLLSFCSWLSGRWEDTAQGEFRLSAAIPGEASKYDEQMFALDREALFDAYKEHMKHLFATAMKSADAQSFSRAQVGATNARKAYIAVMDAIEAREKEGKP